MGFSGFERAADVQKKNRFLFRGDPLFALFRR